MKVDDFMCKWQGICDALYIMKNPIPNRQQNNKVLISGYIRKECHTLFPKDILQIIFNFYSIHSLSIFKSSEIFVEL